jgi:hypothetical protein
MEVWDRSVASRTNLTRYSGTLTTSPWAASGNTCVASATLAPDGVGVFYTITYGSGDWRQSSAMTSGQTYTNSVYCKRGNQAWAGFETHMTGGTTLAKTVRYNFDTDTVVVSSGATATVDKLAGGVVRLALTQTDDGDGTTAFTLLHTNQSGVITGTALYWGAQLELGTRASGYIATTAGATAVQGELIPLYYSTDGFNSGAADAPAHTHYDARVKTALTFTRALFSEGRIGGRSLPGVGVLTLSNGDHGLDWLAHASVDGRACRVLLGGDGFTRADFGTIFDGTMANLDFSSSTVDVRLRDWQEYLARPLLDGSFAGSGTWEGVTSMTGQPKPRAFGKVRNFEPVLIDPANLRYLYHDGVKGGTRTLDAVYDRGVLLTAGVGYTNTAASGGFVLLAAPAGTITCDVTGPNLSAGAIAEEIVTNPGGLVASDLDATAVSDFKTLVPATVGFFARDQINCDEALDQVIGAVGGYWGFDRGGLFDLGRMDAPAVTAVAALTDIEVLSFERVATRLPIWSLTLRYRRNWHPFSLTDLATQFQPGGISANNAKAFTDEWSSLAPSTDPLVRVNYLLAGSAETETLIDDPTAAATERNRLFTLDSVGRDVYRLVAKVQPFARELSDTITLTLNRYGLDTGRNFRIISMTEDSSSNRVELEVWG